MKTEACNQIMQSHDEEIGGKQTVQSGQEEKQVFQPNYR